MCGFLVTTGPRWARAHDAALATLATRGPDASGRWDDERSPHVVLGHRRLSVIDLEGSPQPMVSDDGRHVLAYNGELYNFRELRDELTSQGARFTTQGDTEVVLQALATWGAKRAAGRFDGMFAFAWYDRRDRTLTLARDRLGIKPLFFTDAQVGDGAEGAGHAGGFAAASTLSPLLELPGLGRTLNPAAVRELLATGSIASPHSILQGVQVLPPATVLTVEVESGRQETHRYWEVPGPTSQPMSREALIEAVDAALRKSVKRQAVAEVPLGCFLSGGVDSSLMAYYLAQVSSGPVRTFCVRFPQAQGYDESPHAQQVAQAIGAEHHAFDARDLTGDDFAHAIAALDQPLADPAYLPLLALSRVTRQHVTVALSGDGGDELFGGYPRFLRQFADPPVVWAMLHDRGLLPGALRRRGYSADLAMLYDRVRLGPFPGTRKSLAALLTPDATAAMQPQHTMNPWRDAVERFGGSSCADAFIRADLHTYLADNCLVKTDRATMAASLEARVPMLGNDVVDLVLPQPASRKLGPRLKDPLVTLALRHLPQHAMDRPKHGFSVPLRHDLAGPWRAQRSLGSMPHRTSRPGLMPLRSEDAGVAPWRGTATRERCLPW